MSEADSIAGLGGPGDYVATDPAFNPARQPLTADESRLLACVGRAAKIGEAIGKSGLSLPVAKATLLALRAKGAIRPARVQTDAKVEVADASMHEEVDLTPERKKDILALEAKLGTANYFELLGVPADADRTAITRGYHEASLKFHPDRYFNRNLGSFRGRIEKIFRKLSEAHQTLSDDAKRLAYIRANPGAARAMASAAAASARAGNNTPIPDRAGTGNRTPPPGVGSNTPIPRAAPSAKDVAREQERRARLAHHPYLAKVGKTKELLAAGKAALARGEYDHALQQLNLAVQLDPTGKEVLALLEEVRSKHGAQRARDMIARGRLQLREMDFKGALGSFRSAYSIDARNAEAAIDVAELILQLGENASEAKAMAQKAVELEPKRARGHLALGLANLALDQKKAAKKNFDDCLERDPENEEAKKQLKKVRWVF